MDIKSPGVALVRQGESALKPEGRKEGRMGQAVGMGNWHWYVLRLLLGAPTLHTTIPLYVQDILQSNHSIILLHSCVVVHALVCSVKA